MDYKLGTKWKGQFCMLANLIVNVSSPVTAVLITEKALGAGMAGSTPN
jgi:hypothetical protein